MRPILISLLLLLSLCYGALFPQQAVATNKTHTIQKVINDTFENGIRISEQDIKKMVLLNIEKNMTFASIRDDVYDWKNTYYIESLDIPRFKTASQEIIASGDMAFIYRTTLIPVDDRKSAPLKIIRDYPFSYFISHNQAGKEYALILTFDGNFSEKSNLTAEQHHKYICNKKRLAVSKHTTTCAARSAAIDAIDISFGYTKLSLYQHPNNISFLYSIPLPIEFTKKIFRHAVRELGNGEIKNDTLLLEGNPIAYFIEENGETVVSYNEKLLWTLNPLQFSPPKEHVQLFYRINKKFKRANHEIAEAYDVRQKDKAKRFIALSWLFTGIPDANLIREYYLKKSAQTGNTRGKYLYALILLENHPDNDLRCNEAIALLKENAALNDVESTISLATHYAKEENTIPFAIDILTQLIKSKSYRYVPEDSFQVLATIYNNPKSKFYSPQEYKKVLLSAVGKNDSLEELVAWSYYFGKNGFKQDKAKSYESYGKLCDRHPNNYSCCYSASYLSTQNRDMVDYLKAKKQLYFCNKQKYQMKIISRLKKQEQQGSSKAAAILGSLYQMGGITERSDKTAVQYLTSVIQKQKKDMAYAVALYEMATFHIGKRYEYSNEKSRQYLKESAETYPLAAAINAGRYLNDIRKKLSNIDRYDKKGKIKFSSINDPEIKEKFVTVQKYINRLCRLDSNTIACCAATTLQNKLTENPDTKTMSDFLDYYQYKILNFEDLLESKEKLYNDLCQ